MEAPDNEKRFRCHVCSKLLSTKQRLITHVEGQHTDIPNLADTLKIRKYKQYLGDPRIPVPRTTLCRHRSKLKNTQNNETLEDIDDYTLTNAEIQTKTHEDSFNSSSGQLLSSRNNANFDNQQMLHSACSFELNEQLLNKNSDSQVNNDYENERELTMKLDFPDSESDEGEQLLYLDSENNGYQENEQPSCPEGNENESDQQFSLIPQDQDSDGQQELNLDNSSDSVQESDFNFQSDVNYVSSDSSSEYDNDSTSSAEENVTDVSLHTVTKKNFSQSFSMALLSLITKYHLNGECASDMLQLMNILNTRSEECSIGTLSTLKQTVGNCDAKLIDYCNKCYSLYPQDETVYICPQEGCGNLRFKGTQNQQTLKQRKSYFATLPLETQIRDILERDGMIENMIKYRNEVTEAGKITDITSGQIIQELRNQGGFLSDSQNISLTFNTDGVPLYKSSKVSIWPIYLVINELPPSVRFSIKNVLLWGIWQGQGKPVFKSYLQPFIEDLQKLYTNGLSINVDSKSLQVKAVVLCGTLDLQAKAFVTNMTLHNGEYGCVSCEEPGRVVRQGKGHCRIYPFTDTFADMRTSDGFRQCAEEAERISKTIKGIKGLSPLLQLDQFNLVKGIVPDYMHGVLLGVVKKMLYLQLNPSNSKEPFFIGNHLKGIDQMLKNMRPTDQIARLPRKLETNLNHFKASELLTWLLFYSLPCLKPVMARDYFDHWALLVEGIYILLGDQISEQQLTKAEECLKEFYRNYANLYGQNNCTLNLHNTCLHLPYYVKKLGPLWAWSCFPFEDMNGTVLESVHGTGDVCMQMLWRVQAQKRLSVDVNMIGEESLKVFTERMTSNGRSVKIKKDADNCKIAGALGNLKLQNDVKEGVKRALHLERDNEIGDVSIVLRVVIANNVFFSKQYERVSKRISYYMLVKDVPGADIVLVHYFMYHHGSNKCLAVANKVPINNDTFLHPRVSHLVRIQKETDELIVFSVDKLLEKVIVLEGNQDCICISRLPSLYGHLS